jgi:phosphonoacetaldehyde hydrolase|tara:strand:- start:1915 stop:2715 length:801 start_codon:yes stop_codon:yes gene_type:complete
MRISACIFDLGGTIVDRYSLTPFLSLKKAFERKGIYITNDLISKDMGKNKKEHISDILINFKVTNQWYNKYNDYPDDTDIESLFKDFNKIQTKYSDQVMDILPETKSCIDYLQFNYIKTGSTTGFNRENMDIIKNRLEKNKIKLDSYVSSSCLGKPSRPYPHMINKNMENLQLDNPRSILKIDDTVVGIQEGISAKCLTVGVARWSSNMGINTIEEAYYLHDSIHQLEINERLKHTRKILKEAGANFVIDSLNELPKLIEEINYKI